METGGEARDVGFDELDPEIVLPDQFFDRLSRHAGKSPEHNLVAAVLCDALRCFQKNAFAASGARHELFREVETWFMERGSGAALEFEDVCGALGLDEDYIRARLGRWHERGLGTLGEESTARLDTANGDHAAEMAYRRAVGE